MQSGCIRQRSSRSKNSFREVERQRHLQPATAAVTEVQEAEVRLKAKSFAVKNWISGTESRIVLSIEERVGGLCDGRGRRRREQREVLVGKSAKKAPCV